MDISNFVLSDDALKVIQEGAWIDDLDEAPGVRLHVTGWARNEAVQTKLRTKLEAIQKSQRNKPATDKQRAEVVRELLADDVLKDWDGFKDGGKVLKYDAKLAKQWLTSPNGAALAGLVLSAAAEVDQRANEFVEGVTKN